MTGVQAAWEQKLSDCATYVTPLQNEILNVTVFGAPLYIRYFVGMQKYRKLIVHRTIQMRDAEYYIAGPAQSPAASGALVTMLDI